MRDRHAPFRLLYVGSTDVSGRDGFLPLLEAVLRGGADAFLLREKRMGGRELLSLAREARARTAVTGALLLVSDRIDVALASGADGVLLPENSFTPKDARTLLGPGPLVGRSVHDREGALRAERAGADFLVVGPVFETPGKGPALGLSKAAEIPPAVGVPCLAVGGIDPERYPSILSAGFDGAAAIRALAAAPDPEAAARSFRRIQDGATG
jgi:thiamine-phosphate pyrophosphorylase